jgi:hypothetical protein
MFYFQPNRRRAPELQMVPPVSVASLPQTAIPQVYVPSKSAPRHQPPPSVDEYTSIVMDASMLGTSKPPSSAFQAFQAPADQSQRPKSSHDLLDQSDAPLHGSRSRSGQSGARTQNMAQALREHPRSDSSNGFKPVMDDKLNHKASYLNVDDEDDVIDRVIKPGSSPQPLVNSIREELQRLAERSQQNSMEMK